jgi:hypothetical protein
MATRTTLLLIAALFVFTVGGLTGGAQEQLPNLPPFPPIRPPFPPRPYPSYPNMERPAWPPSWWKDLEPIAPQLFALLLAFPVFVLCLAVWGILKFARMVDRAIRGPRDKSPSGSRQQEG